MSCIDQPEDILRLSRQDTTGHIDILGLIAGMSPIGRPIWIQADMAGIGLIILLDII